MTRFLLTALLLAGAVSSSAADLSAARQAMAGPPAGWPQALADFTTAARNGDAAAAYWAGVMVRNGKGAAPDSAAAIGWLEQAARGGVPEAMFVLANMRLAGEGGDADPAAARAWLEHAAGLGHPGALQQLAQMSYDEGADQRANALLKESAHALKHKVTMP
ncbi:sel1 repeat family protein [Massilia sp. METH4]|uniref:tetratricopeptide repeat protein n=1 Tax=Massilia sp. METH4 TaxID=3123041 RepID=UPI0030CA98FC